jgi:hypothetical protein
MFYTCVPCLFRGKEIIQLDRTYGSMFKWLIDKDNNRKKYNVRRTGSLIAEDLIQQMNQH